ncbi:hypothetical protein H7142_01185 [Candidatus Saccharibacteria bacterium]|nr:hypothetical protein [Candidatus Saccharibacteria bacterium]
MSKVMVARALTARIGLRVVRMLTTVVYIGLGIWLAVTIGLVYVFTAWWWLLLVPAFVLLAIFLVVRLIVRIILRRIHTERLSKIQSAALDGFIDKIQALLEARATPPWVFAAICIKDLLIHRDVSTVRSIISSTASLRSDYRQLEKLF